MKARRPERFSDSKPQSERTLDRSQLEYHIATVTKRNEETQFANFARRVAQHAICPNLLPQTGPTGGGDSRADSETVPTADVLASLWVGFPREASEERWAFAFSAKERWKDKAASDVKKIVETGRGYKKAFFVSSQFVRDKTRAELEAALRTEHGLDVRVLDRTWILDQVFERRLELVAIEEFGLSPALAPTLVPGPLDTERAQELAAIEARITAAVTDGRFAPALVEDAREAALLSRGLEQPRSKVDGLFARAREYATRCGTPFQRFEVTYDQAWTAFWWHEDGALAAAHYAELEAHALETDNVRELELLTNIWIILGVASVRSGVTAPAHAERTKRLSAAIARIEAQVDHPSAALQARTLRLHMQLQQAVRGDPSSTLRELLTVVDAATQFAGFPIEPLIRIIEELGEPLGALPDYGALFEKVLQIREKRAGEIKAAELLVMRGIQHLRANRFTETIRTLGRALSRLQKHESRYDAIRAMALCARAYEQLGLLWAARGTALGAAYMACREFQTYGRIEKPQVLCFEHLKWIELQLGRLPQSLAWHELELSFARNLENVAPQPPTEEDVSFDASLGVAFLNAPFDELRNLVRLPPVLDRLDLLLSEAALSYVIGNEESARGAFQKFLGPHRSLVEQMRLLRDQPARFQLPALNLGVTRRLTFDSRICGARIEVDVDNDESCLALTEAVLGSLEGFLATGNADGIYPREPLIPVRVRRSSFASDSFEWVIGSEQGRPLFEIRCPDLRVGSMSREEQSRFQLRLLDLTAQVFAHGFIASDQESTLERMFRDERAQDRAVGFAGNPNFAPSILGRSAKRAIDDWFDDSTTGRELVRRVPWDSDVPPPPKVPEQERPREVPKELESPDVRHDDLRTESVVRFALWEDAEWLGAGFDPGGATAPPALFLLFKNAAPTAQIFEYWEQEFGSNDPKGRIQVLIVRGVDRRHPATYRLVVRPGLPERLETTTSPSATLAEVKTLEPKTSENLDRFLAGYHAHGRFILAGGTPKAPVKAPQFMKTALVVRDAWEIGPGDLDSMALREDDDPVRPANRKDLPIDQTLQWLRSMKGPTRPAAIVRRAKGRGKRAGK